VRESRRSQPEDSVYCPAVNEVSIYTQLGIDPDHEFMTTDGSPIKIAVEDRPIIKEAIV
jgi:hypothetical protein